MLCSRLDCLCAGLIVTTALMIWKSLVLFTGSESPVKLLSPHLLISHSPWRTCVACLERAAAKLPQHPSCLVQVMHSLLCKPIAWVT